MKLQPVVFFSLCAASFGACSGTNSTATGMDAAGPADMAMAYVPKPLDVESPDGGVPADTTCLGKTVDPAAPTSPTVVNGVVEDFQDSNKVVGATVKIYFKPEDVPDHPAAVSDAPTDADGKYTITVPPGHYRIIRSTDGGKAISSGNMTKTIPTIEFNMKYNDAKPTSVKVTTKEAIPGLVGVTQMDGLGVLAGATRDCTNAEMGGALITATVDGHPEFTSTGATFYMNDIPGAGKLPQRSLKSTTWQGGAAFAVLNVPAGLATITSSGVVKAGGAVQQLSQFRIPVIADAVTIVDMPLGLSQ